MSRFDQERVDHQGSSLVLRYVIAYVALLVLAAGGVLMMLSLRLRLLLLMPLTGPRIMALLDNVGVYLLGAGWLFGVVFLEHHLRRGAETNALWPRIGRVALIEAVILAALFALSLLLPIWL